MIKIRTLSILFMCVSFRYAISFILFFEEYLHNLLYIRITRSNRQHNRIQFQT
jgi:hypothetical protein